MGEVELDEVVGKGLQVEAGLAEGAVEENEHRVGAEEPGAVAAFKDGCAEVGEIPGGGAREVLNENDVDSSVGRRQEGLAGPGGGEAGDGVAQDREAGEEFSLLGADAPVQGEGVASGVTGDVLEEPQSGVGERECCCS